MLSTAHLAWPFFAAHHRPLSQEAAVWASRHLADPLTETSVEAACRTLVRLLGEGGWLRWCVPMDAGHPGSNTLHAEPGEGQVGALASTGSARTVLLQSLQSLLPLQSLLSLLSLLCL